MARRKKQPEPLSKRGTLVFQDPRDKDFFAWKGPTVAELVAEVTAPSEEETQEFKAITIRPTVQEVALLDEMAKLFGESRNITARQLLVAAMREVLGGLPEERRRRIQADAFKRLGWGVMTADEIRELNERGARGESTPLSELCKAPEWLDDPDAKPIDPEDVQRALAGGQPLAIYTKDRPGDDKA